MARTALVVDDSATARMLIKRCIEIAGWVDADIIEAANGQEGLDLLAVEEVDVLITDLNMPVMDGIELLKAVRADEQLFDLPVIVVTSTGNEAKEEELRIEGASKILSKPISPAIIAETLDEMFGE